MNWIKAALAATLATLLLLAGIGATTAPATASDAGTLSWGTSVTFNGPEGAWVKARNMNGVDKILHLGETANNAAKVSPPGSNWLMRVCGRYSCNDSLTWGESYVFTHDGNYDVWMRSR